MGDARDVEDTSNGEPEDTGPPGQSRILKQLSQMLNFTYYSAYIGRKTKYGDRPGPEAWHYTRLMLAERHSPVSVDDVARLFGELGCADEVEACEWLVINDRLLPEQDG